MCIFFLGSVLICMCICISHPARTCPHSLYVYAWMYVRMCVCIQCTRSLGLSSLITYTCIASAYACQHVCSYMYICVYVCMYSHSFNVHEQYIYLHLLHVSAYACQHVCLCSFGIDTFSHSHGPKPSDLPSFGTCFLSIYPSICSSILPGFKCTTVTHLICNDIHHRTYTYIYKRVCASTRPHLIPSQTCSSGNVHM